MKRPDRNVCLLLAALLLAAAASGCGGLNASVPISPLMFMQNTPPAANPTTPSDCELAVLDVSAVRQ